jgi:hypothetical protein
MPVHAAASEHSDGRETVRNLSGRKRRRRSAWLCQGSGPLRIWARRQRELARAAARGKITPAQGKEMMRNSRRAQLWPTGRPVLVHLRAGFAVPERWRRCEGRSAPRITAASSRKMAPDICAYQHEPAKSSNFLRDPLSAERRHETGQVCRVRVVQKRKRIELGQTGTFAPQSPTPQ